MPGLLSLVYLFSRLQNSDGGFSSGFQKGKKLTQILVAGNLKKKKKKRLFISQQLVTVKNLPSPGTLNTLCVCLCVC